MRYIDAWLRMTSTERLECVSSLVGRVLVTDSMPGKISHVHFLAAMVADYVKKNLVVTSADVAQIPREALAPRAQEVVDTATKSKKRGWLQHAIEAARKCSRHIVKLATLWPRGAWIGSEGMACSWLMTLEETCYATCYGEYPLWFHLGFVA